MSINKRKLFISYRVKGGKGKGATETFSCFGNSTNWKTVFGTPLPLLGNWRIRMMGGEGTEIEENWLKGNQWIKMNVSGFSGLINKHKRTSN